MSAGANLLLQTAGRFLGDLVVLKLCYVAKRSQFQKVNLRGTFIWQREWVLNYRHNLLKKIKFTVSFHVNNKNHALYIFAWWFSADISGKPISLSNGTDKMTDMKKYWHSEPQKQTALSKPNLKHIDKNVLSKTKLKRKLQQLCWREKLKYKLWRYCCLK